MQALVDDRSVFKNLRRGLPFVGLFLWLAGWAFASSAAHAQQTPKRYQLVWLRDGVGAHCPGPNQIKDQVRRWLGRDPFSEEASEIIEVAIGMHEDRFRSIVRVRDEQGRSHGERFFDDPGPDCGPAARAATLAVVLIIDPTAPLMPSASSASSLPPAPLASLAVSSSPSSLPPVVSAPVPLVSASPEALPPPSIPPPPLSPPPPKQRGAMALIGGGLVGALPKASGALGLMAERRVGERWWLRAALARSGTQSTEEQRVAFSLTSGWVGLCGRWAGGEQIEARLCASVGAGAMVALVRDLEPLDVGDSLWVGGALGLGGRVVLAGPWFLGGQIDAVTPLRASAYRIEGPRAREVFRPGPGGQLFLETGLFFF